MGNKKYYKKIRFKIFYKETLLNISYLWNRLIIKNNMNSRWFINKDYSIEDYF